MSEPNLTGPVVQNAEKLARLDRDVRNVEQHLECVCTELRDLDAKLTKMRTAWVQRFGAHSLQPDTCKKCHRRVTAVSGVCGFCQTQN